MKIRLRYLFITALVLYWPVIFIFAHMPNVPGWIIRSQISDKTLHYLGYLILVFLWWFSVFPSQKPRFFSRSLWLTFAMMLVYAACDEWLQRFFHRTPDIMDLAADMAGVLTGILIFALAGPRLSALGVASVVIFVLTSVSKADPLSFVPLLDILFYFCSYGLITLLWMGYIRKVSGLSMLEFFLFSMLAPAILLSITLLASAVHGKQFEVERVIAAFIGIIVPALIWEGFCAFSGAYSKSRGSN